MINGKALKTNGLHAHHFEFSCWKTLAYYWKLKQIGIKAANAVNIIKI